MMFLASATSNERGIEDMIRGNRANLMLGGGKVLLEPERPYVDELERADETPPEDLRDDAGARSHAQHVSTSSTRRARQRRAQHADRARRCQVQTVVSMAEKAYRERALVRFDLQSRKLRT